MLKHGDRTSAFLNVWTPMQQSLKILDVPRRITGWWLTYTPLKKCDFVSWGYYSHIFPIYGKIKVMFQTTNQILFELLSQETTVHPNCADRIHKSDQIWTSTNSQRNPQRNPSREQQKTMAAIAGNRVQPWISWISLTSDNLQQPRLLIWGCH